MRLRLLLLTLTLSFVLAACQIYGTIHFFYWKYPDFDIFMHLLGGATMGVLALGLFGPVWSPWRYLAFTVLAAVGWELFEALEGIAVLPGANYAWDTAHDLLNDAIGSAGVYAVARFTVWRPSHAL